MSQILLYPLRFEPIYQYRLWGGRRLSGLLAAPLPGDGPIGEAWVLCDRDDHPSQVADGPLKGRTIGQLLEQSPEQMLGKLAPRFRRFPLLLKFLDAREMLSVQVHPGGEAGKTEAWVVPQPGDAVFLPAGTVHTLGGDVVVFEVQQNSDVTFRLYDWAMLTPKQASLGRSRSIGRLTALISRRVRSVLWRPCQKRPRWWSARDSFNVNISGCGASADSRRFRWAPRVRRAWWYAPRALGRSSTTAPLMRLERATYGSCRRSSEPVLFSRAVESLCWRLRYRNSLQP